MLCDYKSLLLAGLKVHRIICQPQAVSSYRVVFFIQTSPQHFCRRLIVFVRDYSVLFLRAFAICCVCVFNYICALFNLYEYVKYIILVGCQEVICNFALKPKAYSVSRFGNIGNSCPFGNLIAVVVVAVVCCSTTCNRLCEAVFFIVSISPTLNCKEFIQPAAPFTALLVVFKVLYHKFS